MAHFAEIDTNNVVLQVVVVGNEMLFDEQGKESEAIGIEFLQSLFGADKRWVQTSYNANFRKNYAGIGFTWDAARDAFIPPQPYPSWLLNQSTANWEAPVPIPNDGNRYVWNELTQSWDIVY